jgi:signal transduction histidine kinase
VVAVIAAADIADTVAGYRDPFEGASLYPLIAVAWATGNAFRRHGAREQALEARAAALERERERKVRAATAEERVRIARELHDVVAHSISVMVLQVGGARGILDSEPETARDTLRSAPRRTRGHAARTRRPRARRDSRTHTHDLRPRRLRLRGAARRRQRLLAQGCAP